MRTIPEYILGITGGIALERLFVIPDELIILTVGLAVMVIAIDMADHRKIRSNP